MREKNFRYEKDHLALGGNIDMGSSQEHGVWLIEACWNHTVSGPNFTSGPTPVPGRELHPSSQVDAISPRKSKSNMY